MEDFANDTSGGGGNHSSDNEEPLLSILNVVVDHVMLPPSPMEPMEFREVMRRMKQSQQHQQPSPCNDDDEEELFFNTKNDGSEHDNANNNSLLKDAAPSENLSIQVPILRIFGPVLRNGNYDHVISSSASQAMPSSQSTTNSSFSLLSSSSSSSTATATKKSKIPQPQSGCLHLHGAFPYMLARPVVAGPDGSMYQGCYNQTNNNEDDENTTMERLDWDDADSVSNIIEELQLRLEMALRASYENYSNNTNNSNGGGDSTNTNHKQAGAAATTKIPLFIRQITVVTGKGFYTYCAGPPAPFLRVEYYDPSMRWRVKMVLERGVDLDVMYHPNHLQYDYEDDYRNNNGSDPVVPVDGEETTAPLKFRCYEAHIPYTMQVFKDYNLSGLNYCKIGDAKFRGMPTKLRKRFFSKRGGMDDDNESGVRPEDERAFFLQHTTSEEMLWPACDNSTLQFTVDQYWLKKETSCDLEFDTTVHKILNVLDVMKELPSPLEERQKVHWRAVPSLREIWEQERKRMATLLPPENDFLSCMENDADTDLDCEESSDEEMEGTIAREVPPPFTLSVKKHASLPGTRHAVKGMQQLFQSSFGLDGEFRRAMKDIVSRHEGFIDELDERIKSGKSNKTKRTPHTDYSSRQQNLDFHSPSLDDGIEALAALGEQFSQASEGAFDEDNINISQFTPVARSIQSIEEAKAKYEATPLSQEEFDEEMEAMAFTQAVDDDEIIDEEEVRKNPTRIDPFTLEVIDDEEDSCDFLDDEERMGERKLFDLLTQTQRESSQSEDTDSSNLLREDKLVYNEGSNLQILDEENSLPDQNEGYLPPDQNEGNDEVVYGSGESSQIEDKNSAIFPASQSTTGSTSTGRLESRRHMSLAQQSPASVYTTQSSEQESCVKLHGSTFEPVKHVSLRCADIKSSSWFETPRNSTDYPPDWFGFRWAIPASPPSLQKAAFLEPVVRPPSFSYVNTWVKENRKRSTSIDMKKNVPAKQQKRSSNITYQTQGAHTQRSRLGPSQEKGSPDPLAGLGNQGGKLHVSSGGLKTSTSSSNSFTPLTILSIEVHVQCRIKKGIKDHRDIAMVPDPNRDAVFAVVYVYGRDPGGGESLEVLKTGVVLVTVQPGNKSPNKASRSTMGISSSVVVNEVSCEKELLMRLASIVRSIDPDALVSWDTQGAGLGYLIERGHALGKPKDGDNGIVTSTQKIDMARLLGRTPIARQADGSSSTKPTADEFGLPEDDQNGKDKESEQLWTGSGLGGEWDDRVGAGAAAASIVGRIVMCGWKIISEECKHPNASYQPAIVAAVLNKRIPFHDNLLLTRWFSMNKGVERWRVIEYRMAQAMSTVLLFDALDILGRAGEAARLSNVEFSQSLPGIRGSQYKVEGVLLRALQSVNSSEKGDKGINRASDIRLGGLTGSSHETQSQSPKKLLRGKASKDGGYFFYSPSKSDCSPGGQEALECQALTLEPRSGFYTDPIVVCDFTALYPSLVIAYNLCYSTVAGKLEYHSTRREMRQRGRTTKRIGPFRYSEHRTAAVLRKHMESLHDDKKKKKDRAYAAPTGTVFVAESVVKGVLPQVLDEMLSTRAMLKKAAKEYKKRVPNLSPSVLRQIEARQLALKYVANVTYGYTSATFSGRSAAPLVADAIVECGRRTLGNAIALANAWGKDTNGRWTNAEVLYGDTDSIFVRLPGRSISEAFAFGEEFCQAVTESNPPPVQLKLEKVYAGSLLQTKKKYCGMMYEFAAQKRPIFEAKGIETVRKDQCALTQRVLRNALISVFQRGIQAARDYINEQWSLIHSGSLPVSEFVLTGRVRSRYRGGKIGPVQAALARRLAEIDPGRVIRHKERLPYVIVASPGKTFRLRENVLTPLELLEQWDSYSVHLSYYTTKHVNAALQRCFGLTPFNINIASWYESSSKPRMRIHYWPTSKSASNSMISNYFGSDTCSLCGKRTKSTGKSKVAVCNSCQRDSVSAVCTALSRLNETQQQATALAAICSDCNGSFEDTGSFARVEVSSAKGKQKELLSNPLAICICIDCPITYKRHKLRESEIETVELCKALDI